MSTGTLRPESLMVSATPFSSPKLGRMTRMPTMSAACLLKSAAHLRASPNVSTPPNLESDSSRRTAFSPDFSNCARTSARASDTNLSGKKSRLPMMTPKLIFSFILDFLTGEDQFDLVVFKNAFIAFADAGVGDDVVDQRQRAQAGEGAFPDLGGIGHQIGGLGCFDHGLLDDDIADAGVGETGLQAQPRG